MRTSLQWMRDYAQLDAPVDVIVQALVDTGTEVESVHREAEGAVVARVLALTPVPESTRGVQFADLDVGVPGRPVRVITGAANLSVGDLVPYAPPGTLLPGWDEPLTIRAMFGGKYESPGMLCSPVELGVGEDAEGIMILDRGAPGQPVQEVVPVDVVLDLEITTNRPDCLCHVGVAREAAAALGETLREPPGGIPDVLESATAVDGRVSVRVEDPQGCPRFAVRVIEDVVVKPSPFWLQRRLRAAGMRPINNIVDVTNFVAAELGQPLHAFDLERFRKLAGEATPQVTVRRARPGERLVCLDGVTRTLDAEDLVVCAGEHVASLAGVMGGAETAVDERTRTVLLEAATWDGASIRATSRRHALRSEASARFEKGLSDTLPPHALDRAAALIAELGGGHVLAGVVDAHERPLPPIQPIQVRTEYLEGVLGCPVDASEAATALARLGFSVEQDGSLLIVSPPHFRRDVTMAADVAEEVGRSLGYARIPGTLPGRREPVRTLAQPPPVEDLVRDVCVGAGLDEAITYAFTSPALAARLAGVGASRRPIRLRNPLSEEWSVLRTSILPGLGQALALNLNQGATNVSLFEIGRAYWEGERDGPAPGSTLDGADDDLPPLPAEPLLLALVSQTGDMRAETAAARLRHLQSVLAWLGHDLAGLELTVEPGTVPGLRPGRSGTLVADGRPLGVLGELDAATMDAFGLRGRVAVAEVRLDALVPATPRVPAFRQPPRFPAVVQDMAVVVPAAERAGVALAAAREAGGVLLESAELYDEYRDARLGEDRKGWTFRLTYRAADRTLTGAEAQAAHEAIASALRARVGAEVRG